MYKRQLYAKARKLATSKQLEAFKISVESEKTRELYGDGSFGKGCLLARRLVEAGVTYIEVRSNGWDTHNDNFERIKTLAGGGDRGYAALIADLRERGMLERTVVLWMGEFGRTPLVESNEVLGRNKGRAHHPQAFTVWRAGGGIKQGITLGKTDELGFHITEDPVNVHDLHATILRQMGIDHEKLSFRFRGLDFRLTGVEKQQPVQKLLA